MVQVIYKPLKMKVPSLTCSETCILMGVTCEPRISKDQEGAKGTSEEWQEEDVLPHGAVV